MATTTLPRAGGLAFIFGGVCVILFRVLHPPEPIRAATALSPSWGWVHLIGLVGVTATLLGLVAVYVRQAKETGGLGLAGFLLLFFGLVGLASYIFVCEFIMPVIAVRAPTLLDPAGSFMADMPAFAGVLLAFTASSLGALLFGLATVRAGVLPRGAGALLSIGPLMTTFVAHWSNEVGILGAVLFGLGAIWLGAILWFDGRTPVITRAHLARRAMLHRT